MIKSKLGPGLVVRDVKLLESIIDEAITVVGTDYGMVLEYVSDKIVNGHYSDALKSNALRKGSWYRKKISDTLELRQ